MPQPPAPITLFGFRRPKHLAQVLEALARNELAAESELYIFCDGPRQEADRPGVEAVREVAERASGFRRVEVRRSERNLGLAASIIAGVTEVVRAHGRVIVVEDDLVTSPYFLRYMNDGLDLYAEDERVASIHGYLYPNASPLPETFFLRGADCWGWATWARAWALFNPDGAALLEQLQARKLTRAFDLGGAFPYTRMLRDQVAGRNDSWAIRWHASAFLADRLTLYPGRSLVLNIGNDASGTHSGRTGAFDVPLSSTPIRVERLPLEASRAGAEAVASFYRGLGGPVRARLRALGQLGGAVRSLARRAVPEPLVPGLRRLLQTGIWYTGPFDSWEAARAASGGYAEAEILERVTRATEAVEAGRAAYERDAVLFPEPSPPFPVLSTLLRAAVERGGRVTVLDVGGSLGSAYRQARPFLPVGLKLDWRVVEQPGFVQRGRERFQSGPLRFYPSIGEAAEPGPPDVLLFASVLQYLPEPDRVLDEAARAGGRYLLIDRTPFREAAEDQIVVQHVSPRIYPASYPCWAFSHERLTRRLAATWRLLADYDAEGGRFRWWPDPIDYRGLIFERR